MLSSEYLAKTYKYVFEKKERSSKMSDNSIVGSIEPEDNKATRKKEILDTVRLAEVNDNCNRQRAESK